MENTPLVKFIRNHIGDSSGVFSKSSLVKISMIQLTSGLSLKLYLNSSAYDRNIFGSSSKVFGNLRKFSENVRQRSCDLQTSFNESSEIFGKWSEVVRKSSKTPSSVCLRSLVRYCSCHSDIKFISSRHRVISSISSTTLKDTRNYMVTGLLQRLPSLLALAIIFSCIC